MGITFDPANSSLVLSPTRMQTSLCMYLWGFVVAHLQTCRT